MSTFSINEYCDMYLVFGECRSNARAAARVYAERYPSRRHPLHGVFLRLDARIRASGSVLPGGNVDAGVSRSSVATEEEVLEYFEDDPTSSVRDFARMANLSRSGVHAILQNEGMHPFHYLSVQGLLSGDERRRVTFCEWLLSQQAIEEDFSSRVLWTDESTFTREGAFNQHNEHWWAAMNPRVTRSRRHQVRWNINIWAGILGNRIIGPYVLPCRLNGQAYLTFLQTVLPDLLEDVPLALRSRIWFQHDGAPSHYTQDVRAHLDACFPGRWIGRGGPISWPPRSPDLTPMDFFFWGYVKNQVYATAPADAHEVVARIHAVVAHINASGVLENVQRSITARALACQHVHGGHFEHVL